MKITSYDAICNLGNNIDEIYQKAINGDNSCFKNLNEFINGQTIRAGVVDTELPEIDNPDFNIRCNRLLKQNLKLLDKEISGLINKYRNDRIAVISATTNSGVQEYEKTKNPKHFEIGNPALFTKELLGLKGFYTTVSTACSSGLKAFLTARNLLNNNVCDAVIIACTDTLSSVPIFGFHSLEVLTDTPSMPFSKNRKGMNMGEASAVFLVEKDAETGINILGLGESSDVYHSTTPDPEGKEAINAIKMALDDAKLNPKDIDYINAHGTGTTANDIMEANAIYKVFGNYTPVSSTKSMTGHCLGAAAGIETALCCRLIDLFEGKLYPNVYDGEYDVLLPQIKLVNNETYDKCEICMCNSFGFGGTNAIMIMGKTNE